MRRWPREGPSVVVRLTAASLRTARRGRTRAAVLRASSAAARAGPSRATVPPMATVAGWCSPLGLARTRRRRPGGALGRALRLALLGLLGAVGVAVDAHHLGTV